MLIEVMIVFTNYGLAHVTYVAIYAGRPPEERPHRRLISLIRLTVRQMRHRVQAARWQAASRLPRQHVTHEGRDVDL
jgi:hypothetical protein